MNSLHKLLFPQLSGKWKEINLNTEAENNPCGSKSLVDPIICENWVNNLHKIYDCHYSYGGYLEDRATLWKDHYHTVGHTTHIGIDFNVPAGTWVSMPFDAQFVSLEYDPNQIGGWGTRIIVKIKELYVIFAHLDFLYLSVDHIYEKRMISKGSRFGIVGSANKNGGWFPHLHVQCMKTYDAGVDGYFQAVDNLRELFPNPFEL